MDIIADLHTHSVASGHAYSTIMENINAAKNKNLQFLGITDHAPALEDAPKETHFRNLKVIKKSFDNLNVLHGVELSILDEHGTVDLPDEVLENLDYAIASLHYPVYPKNKLYLCTEAAINAMNNKNIFILGHPDDKLLPLDYKAIVKAAKDHHVLLEVNNSSLRPNSFRYGAKENYFKMLTYAKNMNVSVVVSSDSHICYDVGNVELALTLLNELNFPQELVANSSCKRLLDFFSCRKNITLSPQLENLLPA